MRLWLGWLATVAASTHSVSGGDFATPYYTISPALPASLQAGTTYVFNAAGIDASHPFAIGSTRGTHEAWMTGDFTGMSGSTGTITVAVPSDYTGNVVYYCATHSSMTFTMSVAGTVSPSPSPPPPSPPPPPGAVASPPPPPPPSSGGGNTGVIIGLVAAGIVGVGALAAVGSTLAARTFGPATAPMPAAFGGGLRSDYERTPTLNLRL